MTSAADYWKARAVDLIDAYDHPETWPQRDGWYDDEFERRTVPTMLGAAESVLIVGCGAGRQYAFLEPLHIEISGLDFSPEMVAVCRERFPAIRSELDDIVNPAHDWHADAVLCTNVLQTIPPEQIEAAVGNVARFAQKIIILRELKWLGINSDHQWGRDYRRLLPDWRVASHAITDQSEIHRMELIAFHRPRS
jgi:SAM-dependent methyltransferase